MKSGHKHGRSSSVKAGAKRASTSKKASSYKSRKAASQAGSYKTRNASANGSGYRSAKTGRFVTSNAPQITSVKERSATVGRATKRLKTTVTVDLPKARRSK
jgi:hypothetical protein